MLEQVEIERIKKLPFVFVMGKGRSGTTLLQSLLNAHPNIVAPPEAKFMILLFHHFFKRRKWVEKDIRSFVDRAYTDPQFVGFWNISKDSVTENLLSINGYADYATLCKMIYLQMGDGKQDIKLISDKNPLYILFIKEILQIYPEAKFVHIVREPLDNIYSNIKTFHSNAMFNAYQWEAANRIIEERKRAMPERFFSTRYEELVNSPERVLKPLCLFLGIEYTPAMLHHKSFYESASESAKLRIGKVHKNLSAPVNTSHIGKWKQEMNKHDVRITQIITSPYAKMQYGYETELPDDNIKISNRKLLKGKLIYKCWQVFTRMRFRNYKLNMLYCRFFKDGRIN